MLAAKGDTARLAEIERLHTMANFVFVRQARQNGLGDAVRTARGAVHDEPFSNSCVACVLPGPYTSRRVRPSGVDARIRRTDSEPRTNNQIVSTRPATKARSLSERERTGNASILHARTMTGALHMSCRDLCYPLGTPEHDT